MKLILLSYFDLGYSFGFTDSVFVRKGVDDRELFKGKDGETGLVNPLGKAVPFDLDTDLNLLQPWLKFALNAIETEADKAGFGITSTEQLVRLQKLISEPPVESANVYVYPMGIGLLYVEFNDEIPHDLISGFSHFMEFGAYDDFGAQFLKAVSKKMLRYEDKDFKKLTKRDEIIRVFPSFNRMIKCKNEKEIEICKSIYSSGNSNYFKPLEFEYHGVLHFNYAIQLLKAKKSNDDSFHEDQLNRMIDNIMISHLFLGHCQFFNIFFQSKILAQLDLKLMKNSGKVEREDESFSTNDFNILKNLAQLLVSKTQYYLVAEAEEDQNYFKAWESRAQVKLIQEQIIQQSQKMYDFQMDTKQEEEKASNIVKAKRANRLNTFIYFLTSLTLISVITDSINFFKKDDGFDPSTWKVITVTFLLLLIGFFWLLNNWKRSSNC
jgi:hypothetical protein